MSIADKLKSSAKAEVSSLTKKGLEYLRKAIYGLLSLFALSVIQNIYGLERAPTWTEAKELLWTSVKNFPAVLQDWLVSRPYDFIVQDHPKLSAAILVLVTATIILAVLLARANRILNRQSAILQSADANYTLVTQAGIKGRYPHAKQSEDGAPWKSLCDDILHPENTFLCILGANGIDTFGSQKSPLYDALENFRGTIRVVLCKPDGARMRGRAAAVGVPVAEYSRAIKASIRRLKELKKKQHSVDARYYDGQPNWKMIITSTSLWVQYYQPGGPHVDQTPVWLVSPTENGDGLYRLFHMEFDRIWSRCAGSPATL